MLNRLTVRPATLADTQTATSLIHIAMGQFANYLFGAGDPLQAVRVIGKLFTQPQNRFSHQFADMVETDDTAIGIMLSYPARIMNHLNLSMGKQLLGIYDVLAFVRFVRRALPLAFVREANADEYFINTLAVSPNFQGQGIGTHLLSHAEHRARNMHYNKCALTVEVRNLRALHLYERLGYRVVETITFDWPKQLGSYKGYHRMVKAL